MFKINLLSFLMVSSVFADRLQDFSAQVAFPAGKDMTVSLVGLCSDCSPQMQLLSEPIAVDGGSPQNVSLKFNEDGINLIRQKNIPAVFILAQNQTFQDGTAVANPSELSLDQNAVMTKIAEYTKKVNGNYFITPNITEDMVRQGLLTTAEAQIYANLMRQQLPAGLMVVARVSGTVNQTVTTNLSVAKSKLAVDGQNKIALKFPEDFSAPVTQIIQAKRPDYELAISNMKEAEKLGCEKIYPKKFFSEHYLRSLPDTQVMNLIKQSGELVIKLRSRPPTQATLTTLLVDSLCEYKQLAAILVKAATAVVASIITGGTAAGLFQELGNSGAELAAEIKRLKG